MFFFFIINNYDLITSGREDDYLLEPVNYSLLLGTKIIVSYLYI